MSETPSNPGAGAAPQPPTPPNTPASQPQVAQPQASQQQVPQPRVPQPTAPQPQAAPAQVQPQQVSQPQASGAHRAAPAAPATPAPPQQPAQQVPAQQYQAPAAQPVATPAHGAYQAAAYTDVPAQSVPVDGGESGIKKLFTGLFDLSFTTYATPAIAKLVYILSLVAIWGVWLFYLIMGPYTLGQLSVSLGVLTFLGVLVLGALVAFLLTLIVRTSIEFAVATIKIAENTNRLRELQER